MFKVLIFLESSLENIGGVERWALEVAKRLERYYHFSVQVIGLKTSSEVHFEGVSYFELPIIRLSRLMLPAPNLIHKLYSFIASSNVGIFIPCYSVFDVIFILIGAITRKPIIAIFQNPPLVRGNIIHNLAFKCFVKPLINKFVSACQVLNPYHYLELRKLGIKVNLRLIPQGVDTGLFCMQLQPRHERTFRVLFVGRLSKQKGVYTLYECAKLSLVKGYEIRFVVAGPIADEKETKKIVHSLLELPNIEYMGIIDHEELPKLYSRCDSFILPSKYEGFPLSALEAQACGLPIVVSDLPEIRWILEHVPNREVITLADPNDPQAFLEGIAKYLDEWKKGANYYSEYFRKKSRENAEMFSWNIIMDKIKEMVANQGGMYE